MNKRRLHHFWTKIRFIKPWYFLILAVVFGAICTLALRANNQKMLELRQAVYTADEQGTDVQQPLRELQQYVTSHMNTNLSSGPNAVYPPIQLKYTYERLTKANQGGEGSQLYAEAQRVCEAQFPSGFSGGGRIPCIQQYVQSHSTAAPAKVPDALYKFSFASPKWSPDLAGWTMVLTVVSILAFVFSLLAHLWFRKYT